MSGTQKDIKKMLNDLVRNGWRIRKGQKHYTCYAPDGKGIVVISGSPRGPRVLSNDLGRIRKANPQSINKEEK